MSKHVMIAEDDKFLAEMVGKFLRTRGVRVTIVHSGHEALAAIEKDLPDVLLLDILMPELSGFGVMELMKQKKLECPVVVMSNLSDKETRKKCREMCVKVYFVKSEMDDETLWPAIEQHLR